MSINFLFVLLSLIVINTRYFCKGISVEEDLTLTYSQKLALDRFKEMVTKDLTHEYMKTDIYLIKYLRAKFFDTEAAKQKLMEALEWRKENGIDNILNERFPFSEREYPFYFDGVDRTGRPVGSAEVTLLDARKAVVAGKLDEALRYGIQNIELGMEKVRVAQAKGFNVTQVSLILDLQGFNIALHACLQCIPYYIRFLMTYQNYYPGMVHKFFFINAPSAVDVLVRVLFPLLDPASKQAVKFYGTNKREWKREILKEISADQIRPPFGGSMYNDNDLDRY